MLLARDGCKPGGLYDPPEFELSSVNTAAALNWKIGKSFLGDQSLSFQVEYQNALNSTSANNSQPNVTGLIQFKMAGF